MTEHSRVLAQTFLTVITIEPLILIAYVYFIYYSWYLQDHPKCAGEHYFQIV